MYYTGFTLDTNDGIGFLYTFDMISIPNNMLIPKPQFLK